ncbi:hypothetical protein [Micromonospora endolithica]|uniref:hypothetical protein n=1 Tax=Micromonospora endolithica TaxID=230091 RepID=UPI0011BE2A20|nr:hypothetical protein [Micromonospora endolithica]
MNRLPSRRSDRQSLKPSLAFYLPIYKLDVYRSLGLHLSYTPETQTVRASVDLAAHRWDSVRVRGLTRTDTHHGLRLVGAIPLG